ncbi:zinc ABC transporter substrate-binding protein [Pasteurellaceae bacterium Macca]|nr:zinc ABC transporter substrate-binding protein [Pasteurellaceae bacterium Macca]
MLKKSMLALALCGAVSVQANVLSTIKPLGFIANAITDGVTESQVLLPVSASPHDYSLKPSDVAQLQSAQLVLWVGDEMETFLEKSILKLPKEKVLTLGKIPEVEDLVESSHKPHKAGEAHHEHQHEHDHSHGEHHHDEDWHIWLSPQTSEVIASHIAERLIAQMPEQKAKIEANLADFKHHLANKQQTLRQQLAKVQGKGYYTFHDAYGYFEKAFGLNSLGSFTINPTVAPGAKTLQNIKQHIAEHKALCLFTEPQFTPKVVESLSKNTSAKVGALDPLGAKITPSKTAYLEFLQALGDEFSRCLAP